MSQESLSKKSNNQLPQQEIRQYLLDNPNFFDDNPDLLAEISLPHESGRAVSLVERQVSVLRERNMEMRHRLNNILETAKENDKLFERTKRLVLGLLEAESLNQITDTLYHCLESDFDVEFYSLTLFGQPQSDDLSNRVSEKQAQTQIGSLLQSNRPLCGILRETEVSFLFGDKSKDVGSVAAIPIGHGQTIGILALGNRDPQYYRSSMGTLFLSQIAEILNRLIPRFST